MIMCLESTRQTAVDDGIAALAGGDFQSGLLREILSFGHAAQPLLFDLARQVRDYHFPEKKVEVRSVIELSNTCVGNCRYCNMASSLPRERYRIEPAAFEEIAAAIYRRGRRVLLLQSGENPAQSFVDYVCRCIETVKSRFSDLCIMLCLGNLHPNQYRRLRQAGAERYILKFETSNPALYRRLKPHDSLEQRLACIEHLLSAGFAVGTGNIIGLPGQSLDDIVADLLLAKQYPVSMMSCSVFIPSEDSPYRDEPAGSLDLTLTTMALMRIMNPRVLVPTTSSLEKAEEDGQYRGLMAGANTVTVHDGTPPELKRLFPIYSLKRVVPNEAHLREIVHRAGMRVSMEALHG
jgi:biotin synthase